MFDPNKAIIRIISVFIICCHSLIPKAQDSTLLKYYGLDANMLKAWKNDINGCKKIRGSYANDLERNDKILGISKKLFLDFFGKPDDTTSEQLYIYGDH